MLTLLLALGLFALPGAVAIAAAMLVGVGIHWRKGPMAVKGGYELALTNLAAASPWASSAQVRTRSMP
jgi:uncharacterized membrane protein YphA (DoxX/SURF4 family)